MSPEETVREFFRLLAQRFHLLFAGHTMVLFEPIPRREQAVSLDHLLHDMRLFKSRPEVDTMRESARIAAGAHKRAMRFARPGRTEYEVMAELLHEFRRHNADISYHPIVGGGANTCISTPMNPPLGER